MRTKIDPRVRQIIINSIFSSVFDNDEFEGHPPQNVVERSVYDTMIREGILTPENQIYADKIIDGYYSKL